jgi:hypothetical protein
MQHPGPCVLGYVCAVRTVCLLYVSRYMCHGDEMCSCTPGTVTTMGGKVQLRSCGVSCRDPQSTVTGTVYSKNFIRLTIHSNRMRTVATTTAHRGSTGVSA